jgi:hypothetical protein
LVNRGTGSDTWKADADLALVAINSAADPSSGDAPVDLQVVGHVETGDPESTYSFATDFATVDAATQDFATASADKSDPSGDSAPRGQDRDAGGTTRPMAFTAAGLVLLAAVALVVARSRRIRRDKGIAPRHGGEAT